jgi:hypothetical protein
MIQNLTEEAFQKEANLTQVITRLQKELKIAKFEVVNENVYQFVDFPEKFKLVPYKGVKSPCYLRDHK